jgi:hypothetical protein
LNRGWFGGDGVRTIQGQTRSPSGETHHSPAMRRSRQKS